jgi:glyoxylase-like metal-dependent hydrolase (beta-lactamase superfamily II)
VRVETLTVGPFQENTYLVIDEDARACVLIDPGDESDRIVERVQASGARLEAIWVTHAHLDHVGGIAGVKRVWDVPIYLNHADEMLYRMADRQAAAYGLLFDPPPPPDHEIHDGDQLVVGGLGFDVMHLPGHAPGHVVIHGHGAAFVGDVLFAGSIGRTDLPLSNPRQLAASLQRLLELPDETVVYSGHGPPTTIGEERRSNPFLNGAARIVGA